MGIMNKKMFNRFMQVACELVIAEIFIKFGVMYVGRDIREWPDQTVNNVIATGHIILTILCFAVALLFLWLAYKDFSKYLEARKEWKAEAK
jgi:uncharacterized membrane protein YozB (DUF420 family)